MSATNLHFYGAVDLNEEKRLEDVLEFLNLIKEMAIICAVGMD